MSKGNVTQYLTPPASGTIECFDPRRATEFAQKSMSEETRRAYSRVVREFFAAIGNLDPRLVGPAEVVEWRDKLQRKRQKAATISFKCPWYGPSSDTSRRSGWWRGTRPTRNWSCRRRCPSRWPDGP